GPPFTSNSRRTALSFRSLPSSHHSAAYHLHDSGRVRERNRAAGFAAERRKAASHRGQRVASVLGFSCPRPLRERVVCEALPSKPGEGKPARRVGAVPSPGSLCAA